MSCVTAKDVAFRQNKKVLLVSMENTKKSMDTRLEALYYKVPFGDLKGSIVDIRTEEYWKSNISNLIKEDGDIWVVDSKSVKTIADLDYHIASLEPDFVIVDGSYKLDSVVRGAGHERAAEVVQALEDTAKTYDIPLLATSQLKEEAQKATEPTEFQYLAKFTKNYVLNPNSCVAITATNDDHLYNRVQCTIVKAREVGDFSNVKQRFAINSDRVTMNFDEQQEDYYDEEGINSLF